MLRMKAKTCISKQFSELVKKKLAQKNFVK